MNNLNPVWKTFKVSLNSLCSGDHTRTLTVRELHHYETTALIVSTRNHGTYNNMVYHFKVSLAGLWEPYSDPKPNISWSVCLGMVHRFHLLVKRTMIKTMSSAEVSWGFHQWPTLGAGLFCCSVCCFLFSCSKSVCVVLWCVMESIDHIARALHPHILIILAGDADNKCAPENVSLGNS